MFINLLGIFFTFIFSSLVIFLLLGRFVQKEESEVARLFFLTIGLGPITISWLLRGIFYFFPGQPDILYIGLITVFIVLLFIFCIKYLYLLKCLYQKAMKMFLEFDFLRRWMEIVLFLIIIIMMGAIFYQATFLPITANDTLKYATEARLIYKHKTISIYPFSQADKETGYFSPSSHPLGYQMLMVWCYMLQGTSSDSGLIKTIEPFYLIYFLLLINYYFSRKGIGYGVLGMFIFLSSPLIISLTISSHIDTIRIYLFYLSFVWLFETIEKDGLWRLIITGISVGMSMFIHSIGLLTLPFSIFVYFLRKKIMYKKIFGVAIITIIAFLIGGSIYISNYQRYGAIIKDGLEVWNMEELSYTKYIRQTRHIDSASDKIGLGFLKGFSKPESFGITYWLFALALIFNYKFLRTDALSCTFLPVILLFYALVLLSMLFGMDVAIKNDRYILTLHPFIVYGGALFIGYIYEQAVNS